MQLHCTGRSLLRLELRVSSDLDRVENCWSRVSGPPRNLGKARRSRHWVHGFASSTLRIRWSNDLIREEQDQRSRGEIFRRITYPYVVGSRPFLNFLCWWILDVSTIFINGLSFPRTWQYLLRWVLVSVECRPRVLWMFVDVRRSPSIAAFSTETNNLLHRHRHLNTHLNEHVTIRFQMTNFRSADLHRL